MPDHEPPAGAILVGVTDTPEARAAATYAAQLAADTTSPLLLAHAYWTPSNPLDVAGHSMIGQLRTTAQTLVDQAAAQIRSTSQTTVRTAVAAEKPERFLSRLAETASTLVLGQDTATLFDRVTFGAVAGHLAATAPCPVVIVPATWQPGSVPGHPVVALVGDHPVPATLAAAIAEATRLGTGLLALHLVRDTAPAADLEQQQRDLAAAAEQGDHPAVSVETRVVRGNPHDHLIHESVNAAAAVVGRPHHHGTTGWMRSVAHAVMKRTHCPLIIVPDS